jgi:hypothetical protein
MSTELDGIAATEQKDISGETLSIAGCDIGDLERGVGFLNDNHSSKLADSIGRVTYAKKILKAEDCEDERQRYFYDKVKGPYLYFKGRLYDQDGDHRSAKAVAAILRHQHKDDSPLKLKVSVEGGVVKRGDKDETRLEKTKIKGLAITLCPCNPSTLTEGLNLKKSDTSAADEALIKSMLPFVRTDVPSFIEIADVLSEGKIRSNVEKIKDLVKALTAGFGGGAPTDKTGGQVLQTESVDSGNKIREIECPECGKSNVYMKYQIRCRNCGKAYPFDTLSKFFIKE